MAKQLIAGVNCHIIGKNSKDIIVKAFFETEINSDQQLQPGSVILGRGIFGGFVTEYTVKTVNGTKASNTPGFTIHNVTVSWEWKPIEKLNLTELKKNDSQLAAQLRAALKNSRK